MPWFYFLENRLTVQEVNDQLQSIYTHNVVVNANIVYKKYATCGKVALGT